MFTNIKRAWKAFRHHMRAKLIWNWPRQSEVLIFDAAGQRILMEYLKPWHPEILHVRGEHLNVLILLKSLFKRGGGTDAYIDCFIEKVRPRLVITTIDNNWNFYAISLRHPEVKTIFIQNAGRSYDDFFTLKTFDSDTLSKFFVDHMFVFASTTGGEYSKYVKGNITPMGSMKNNFVCRQTPTKQGVLAYLSSWRPLKLAGPKFHMGDINISYEEFFELVDRLVVPYLASYAKKNNKRLMIIPCSTGKLAAINFTGNPNTSDAHNAERSASIWSIKKEEAYFRKLLGHEPEFIELEGLFPSYQAIDSAEVVVSLDGTMGYESVARGNKTAHFSIRFALLGIKNRDFGWPGDFSDEGLFWTNKPDPDSFTRILDYLFEVDDAQWKKDVDSTNFSSAIAYNPGNTIFKAILEKELGAPPTSTH